MARVSEGDSAATYEVEGTGTIHRVRLDEEQDRCTCPWFSKYLGQRGPCKHILAANLVAEGQEAGQP